MPGWTCFMIYPTQFYRHYIRRYSGQFDRNGKAMRPCPLRGNKDCHDSTIELELQHHPIQAPSTICYNPGGESRWPKACACGYVFQADDNYQDGFDLMWKRGDDTAAEPNLFKIHQAPIGALWTADWLIGGSYAKNNKTQPGWPLMCMTPAGYEWLIDGPSTNGNGWTRTGPLPKITVNPSISQVGYHGWCHDGVLSLDLEGRQPVQRVR
jgi:hypothetical protein